MSNPQAQNAPKPKTYYMTKEEQLNLAGRDAMASQHSYLANLIRNDINEYFDTVVKKRLNLKPEQQFTYDIDKGIIQVFTDVKQEEIKK